jgi:hypothetical protein
MILANNLNDLNVSERLWCVRSWPVIAITSVSPKDVVLYRILANNLNHFVSERLGCVGSWRKSYFYLFNDAPVGN